MERGYLFVSHCQLGRPRENELNRNSIKILVLLLSLGFIWGSGYTLAKVAMSQGVPPLGYAFWQSLGPALLLMTGCLFGTTRQPGYLIQHWPYFVIAGLLGIAIPNTNMYFIAPHLPAGLLAVLVNTVPLLVYPMALALKQERFDSLRLTALCIGMTGILFIIQTPIEDAAHSYWSLLALLSPLAFASCSVFIAARTPKELGAIASASGMLFAATVLLLPFVWQQEAFYSLWPPFNLAKLVVLTEIVLSTTGYILFFNLIRIAGPVYYSLTGGVVALTGLFWGFIVFHEIPSMKQTIAAALVIIAILLLSWRQSCQSKLKEQYSC